MSAKLETIQTEAETLRKKLDEEDVQLQAERDLFNKEKEALAQEKALMNNLQEFKSRKVRSICTRRCIYLYCSAFQAYCLNERNRSNLMLVEFAFRPLSPH